jgi:hypothetical protein
MMNQANISQDHHFSKHYILLLYIGKFVSWLLAYFSEHDFKYYKHINPIFNMLLCDILLTRSRWSSMNLNLT